jgi:hypothetical protein
MTTQNRRRAPGRTRAAEKASNTAEQVMVLILGTLALLGFLVI